MLSVGKLKRHGIYLLTFLVVVWTIPITQSSSKGFDDELVEVSSELRNESLGGSFVISYNEDDAHFTYGNYGEIEIFLDGSVRSDHINWDVNNISTII